MFQSTETTQVLKTESFSSMYLIQWHLEHLVVLNMLQHYRTLLIAMSNLLI